jgi:hypothetical protein
MGCDVHMWVEVLRGEPGPAPGATLVLEEVNGVWTDTTDRKLARFVWQKVGDTFPYPYYRDDEPVSEWNTLMTDQPYVGRNYDLFAILANVRNGYGFAGAVTGEGLNPISEPRGVPDDASPEYTAEVERWGRDGHSHSWLTLAELHAYDWDQVTRKRGVVSPGEYQTFRINGRPDSYSAGVSGSTVRMVDNAAMDTIVASSPVTSRDDWFAASHYTEVWWEETSRSRCEDFLTTTLPLLDALTEDSGTDVRIVFFFDN